MPASGMTPTLGHVYRLDKQLQADRGYKLDDLRERDHAIGQGCTGADDTECLLQWLEVAATEDDGASGGWLNEEHAALMLRLAALFFGLLTMTGFLLASDRALINVFLLLLIFVLLPLLTSVAAAWAMFRSVRGSPPAVFPLNPARFVTRHALPDKRYLKESSSVLRLLLLKYGQEFGALFAVGVMMAFLGLLAFNDFSFVWGSTFGFSDALVARFTSLLASPWSALLSSAMVSPEVIADTRYHAAQFDLSQMSADSRRGWWPFLFMCLAVYALLPRLLLWFASRRAYRKEVRRALLAVPGASGVLARMRAPVVTTRAIDSDHVDVETPTMICEEGAVLLDWAGAMDQASVEIKVQHKLRAGLGSPADDLDSIELINRLQPVQLLVAVKAWEPPMADLADVLAEINGVSRCSLQLVSLAGREMGESSFRDWQKFARQLPFVTTEVVPLGGQ
ncbi:MAG: DUF2868 domain-containing protein [Halioglobus sp.]